MSVIYYFIAASWFALSALFARGDDNIKPFYVVLIKIFFWFMFFWSLLRALVAAGYSS